MSDDGHSGYPRGWFVIGWDEDFPAGEVKSLHYFGQRLVAWRDAGGQLAVLDAYCPHLGADLAVGGRVVDGTVRCPFHAWRFDRHGSCVDVPYADKIPPRAKIRSWPVLERNKLVYIFHARGGGEAEWEPPKIPEIGDPEWLDWIPNCMEVATHPREIVENVADSAHFPVVHGTHVTSFENEYTDHMAIQRTAGMAYPRGGGEDEFALVATYYGPAVQISVMEGYLSARLLLAHTPIDEGRLDLRFGVALKRFGDGEREQRFGHMYAENLRTGFHEDIRIWEHKVYRPRPVLCDGDGPIGKLRRWYRQFYA